MIAALYQALHIILVTEVFWLKFFGSIKFGISETTGCWHVSFGGQPLDEARIVASPQGMMIMGTRSPMFQGAGLGGA